MNKEGWTVVLHKIQVTFLGRSGIESNEPESNGKFQCVAVKVREESGEYAQHGEERRGG